MRLLDVNQETARLKYELGDVRKFVNDMDRPAFLVRELMGFGVGRVPVGHSS